MVVWYCVMFLVVVDHCTTTFKVLQPQIVLLTAAHGFRHACTIVLANTCFFKSTYVCLKTRNTNSAVVHRNQD